MLLKITMHLGGLGWVFRLVFYCQVFIVGFLGGFTPELTGFWGINPVM